MTTDYARKVAERVFIFAKREKEKEKGKEKDRSNGSGRMYNPRFPCRIIGLIRLAIFTRVRFHRSRIRLMIVDQSSMIPGSEERIRVDLPKLIDR